MPVPHLEIRIVQRSKGSSAVAGAAYQAGEKLFSEYDQKFKDHRRKQQEVVYTEIMLPTNAPPEYADRATLWNSAEEVEKQWNSQLARRFVVALPREVPLDMCPQMLQEYCREHFVSKGMCCDFAIHDPDPPGHNPHCHIMLTMRAIDENGQWLPKSRKVYDLDENGERIRLPSGRWKSHKEDTVDWNEQYHAEEWRHGWEVIQNKYLELAGSAKRVDMRSYERQGLDVIPTVHMGAAVSALERKGIETNIGNLNRDIKAANYTESQICDTMLSQVWLSFLERRDSMSEKRRDNRNRILREGEYQRTDGRYRYRYIDEDGKEKNVYSWRLDKNDPTPKGKKRELSLREKEKQIQADLFDHIVTNGGNYTVVELVEKYVSLKTGVSHNTRAGYKTVINILNKEAFGKLRIDKVRLSDAKAWLIKLQQVDGRGYSSIHSIRGVLRPAFQLAVDDDLIRKNPFGFELASVIVNDSVTREAITRKQERELLKFIKEDKHFCRYYDAIYILFNTGLRISEFCGLTFSDIEFDQKRIKVDHQLQRTSQMQYVIQDPKTESGIRYVPMSEEVVACFRRILANRVAPKVEPMVDGYAGFLFLDKNDRPMVALHWEKYLQHIVERYNKIYRIQMPKVTPHVCRHTFCSNMAKSGMNPKTLQYIMGHSDISVTLNVYTHVQFDDAQAELLRVAEA